MVRWIVLALALGALTFTAPVSAAPIITKQPHGYIVNGVPAGSPLPWQVGLVTIESDGGVSLMDVFCGGVVRDATHIITAAHCVPDRSAAELAVVWNADRLDEPAAAHVRRVAAITSHPGFSDVAAGNDLAILTLAPDQALPLELAPEPFASWPITPPNATWENEPALVSGWGLLADGSLPIGLQVGSVRVLPNRACANYGADYAEDTMLCAGRPDGTVDACQGDSGGPLVADEKPGDRARPLLGIVSYGQGCAERNFPGIYTRLANPDLNARALDPNPPPRADPIQGPTVQGAPVVGQVVTCDPGQWTQPGTFAFLWLSARLDANNRPTNVRRAGTSPTLALTAAHAGRIVGCAVTATGAGGNRQLSALSVAVAPEIAAAAVPSPRPAPPPAPPPAHIPGDLIAPKSRFTRRSCSRRTRRCSVTITATDSGGPARRAKLTFRRITGCKKGKRGRRCRKTRTLKVRSRGKGVFTARTPRLKPARYRFTVVATDAAGNRSKRASTVLTVRRR